VTDLIKQAKVTWKDIVGILSVLAGTLTQANVASLGLPSAVSKILIIAGFALVAISRVAETVDNYVLKKWASLTPAGRAELELIYQKLLPELNKVAKPIDTELVKVKTLLNEAGYSVVVDPNAPVVANPAPPAPTPQAVATTQVATTGRAD